MTFSEGLQMKTLTSAIFLYLVFLSFFRVERGFAAEAGERPTLQLPEVVITGEDKAKVKRVLKKEVSLFPEATVLPTQGDRSRDLVKQGDLVYMTSKDQARTYYMEAIRVDPQNATAYLRLGDLEAHQGHYEQAAENYKKALQVRPDLAEAHYKLGILYDKRLKEVNLARSHYESYLQLGGKDPRVSYWLQKAQE